MDVEGYRPEKGETDKYGYEIEDRIYNQKDFDRSLVIDERTRRVAHRVSEFLKESGDRFQKTIVFCVDTPHAARMRQDDIQLEPPLAIHADVTPAVEDRTYLGFVGAALLIALAGGFVIATALPLIETGALDLGEGQ